MASAAAVDRVESSVTRLRFVATIFTGSFLLFLVQPLIGRMALPRLGGASAVWNSAMLVYQAMLLAGYAYAHWLGRLAPRAQARLQLSMFALAALLLPIGLISASPSPNANPFIWVPWLLLVSIGPLFFVVASQAPVIQRWYALSTNGDPYPLYVTSNLGSFAGLLSYPLIVEPLFDIDLQSWTWTAGYVFLMLLVAWCALGLPHSAATTARNDGAKRPAAVEIRNWILLAAVPSGLVLSTTLYLTTDIVAMPLLWVLPLSAYLLSFTVAFSPRRILANLFSRLAPVALLVAAWCLVLDVDWLGIPIAIINLFVISVALHSQLFDRRPDPQNLTFFYLMMALGGVIGGIFCALIAPILFDWTYEHPLLLVAAALLLGTSSPFSRFVSLWNGDATGRALTWIGVPTALFLSMIGQDEIGWPGWFGWQSTAAFAIIGIALVAIGNRILFATAICALLLAMGGWDKLALSAAPGKMTRSFFGIYQVRTNNAERVLVHGTTVHGVQNLGSPERERMASSYYAEQSGAGLAMRAATGLFGPNARIAVVGLGAGTLACYAQPGQHWVFYEIDPVVVTIATDPSLFTFLSSCKPDAAIEVGDARLLIERATPNGADILVVDAFSSDSVPMHLLTREAFALYRRHLQPNGLLLVHVSNRYLDLEPVVEAATRAGWHAQVREHLPSKQQLALNESISRWIAISPSAETINQLVASTDETWLPLPGKVGFQPWTDAHGSILPLIKW